MRTVAGLRRAAAGQDRSHPPGARWCRRRPADMIVRDRVGDELPGADGRGRTGRRRARGRGRHRPARPLRGRAPAAGAGDRRWPAAPRTECPGSSAWTSRPAAWTRRESMSSARSRSRGLAGAGSAVLVATHDVEFAARVRRAGGADGRGRGAGRRHRRRRSWRAAGTSRPRWRARSAPAARSRRSRGRAAGRAGARRVSADGLPARDDARHPRVVLAVGFAWYERSRPSARVVALVAALAALAVASRLVLAPIPNVVGTTDVALLTGYALGGAPGFTVGALAAPISNIWLGQGPWTHLADGGLGTGGPRGGRAGRRRRPPSGPPRPGLACAAMGLVYGALLDLSVMVTYGGEQSLDRYLVLSARGIPFNVAHAAGNFAIAFAAGPALVAHDRALPGAARVHLASRRARCRSPLAALVVSHWAAATPTPARGRRRQRPAPGCAGAQNCRRRLRGTPGSLLRPR